MDARIVITPKAHWFNAALLWIASYPVLVVDGHQHRARWDKPSTLGVDPGTHFIAVGIIYRGTRTVLGTSGRSFTLAPAQLLNLRARNGVLNSTPFALSIEGQDR